MICQHCDAMREIEVKGMCRACYMRERRSADKGGFGRRQNGKTLEILLSTQDERIYDRLDQNIDRSDKDGCHVWRGATTKGGYGVMHIAGYTILAHRAVHAINTGDTAAEVVMHTCDNPKCCNPQHLRSGTHQENMDDMHMKGRWNKGNCGHHLRDRANHPRSRPVATPEGDFPSAKLAAEAVGITYAKMKYRLRNGVFGYRYL